MDPGIVPHRKRCRRWDVEFDAHCLTFSCFRRQPFLRSGRACGWFLQALGEAKRKHPFDLWAYVLMPEHVHLILWPRDGTKISAILKGVKLSVANRCLVWARAHSRSFLTRMEDRRPSGAVSHRFWQRGGGYDRNLRNDREVHEKILYVHLNPIRRGLVRNPEDWPWSSVRAFATGLPEPIPLDLASLPPPPLHT